MLKTYLEAQKYLESLIPSSDDKKYRNLRLERIEHLLLLIDNPHQAFKTVHVGGTSGKGSTAYLISKILTCAGYKTGLHISPHLQKINERMQINNKNISDQKLINLINWLKPYVEKVERSNPFGSPSYFEVLIAATFEYFKRENIDIAVVEVGLGGSHDATNVIAPLVSVITNVDLDHTELLGNTVEKIAEDKSGIIKKNIEVITAIKQKNVLKIIKEKCFKQKSPLTIINLKNIKIKKINIKETIFDLKTKYNHYKNLHLSLLGRHQVENAALSIITVELLKKYNFEIKENNIKNALKNSSFAGRFEIIQKNPLVILDGAHNPAKMKAFIQTIKELFNQKITIILGFKKKKDMLTMIKQLLPIAKKIILTKFQTTIDTGKNLSVEPGEIAQVIKKYKLSAKYEIINKPISAIKKTFKITNKEDIICITGSLYLVGEARNFLFAD